MGGFLDNCKVALLRLEGFVGSEPITRQRITNSLSVRALARFLLDSIWSPPSSSNFLHYRSNPMLRWSYTSLNCRYHRSLLVPSLLVSTRFYSSLFEPLQPRYPVPSPRLYSSLLVSTRFYSSLFEPLQPRYPVPSPRLYSSLLVSHRL